MRLSWCLRCVAIVLIVSVYCCSANNGPTNTNNVRIDPVHKLNLKDPLAKIGSALSTVLAKPLNLTLLLDALFQFLQDCLPALINGTSASAILDFEVPLDVATKLNNVVLLDLTAPISEENITRYCNGPDFAEIHNYLWIEGRQFKDLVKFFYNFGYPDVYTYTKGWYTYYQCPQDLTDSIPDGPEPLLVAGTQYKKSSSFKNQVLSPTVDTMLTQPFQSQCGLNEILGIVMKLGRSGILRLLHLVRTLFEEIVTDPSLHFLLGKVQEPVKGPAFRTFRLKTPVRKLFTLVHYGIVENEFVADILDLVESLTGLSLKDINLIDVVLNIVEALFWGNLLPVPPELIPMN